MGYLKLVNRIEGKITYDKSDRFASLLPTGIVERNRVETDTLAQLSLSILRYSGTGEESEDASIADSRRNGKFCAIVRGDLINDDCKNRDADGMCLIMLRRCLFTRCVENRIEERYVLSSACKGGTSGEESSVIPPARDDWTCCRADVTLEVLDVGLLGGFYTGAFRDVLRVRGEHLGRRLLRGARERDVSESAFLVPTNKVVSPSDSSLDVVVSSFSPI